MQNKFVKLRSIVITLVCLTLSSCGVDDAPPESTITFNPSTFTIIDAGTTRASHTLYFTIDVTNTETPLGSVNLIVSAPFASPDASALLQFYDQDGVRVNSPYSGVTNSVGTLTVRVDFDSGAGLAYKLAVTAQSGPNLGSAEIEVKVSEE